MSTEYGLTTQSASLRQLIAGPVEYRSLLLDAAATAAVGQVVQYNTTNNNYDDFTSDVTAEHYAVVAEAKTLAADTMVSCIVSGRVRKAALDATAQADDEIETALLKSGIIAVGDNERTS